MGDADLSASVPDLIQVPTIAYADIYKKNTVYIGPRKVDDEAQAEFTFGDGSYVVHFLYRKSTQDMKRGGDNTAKKGTMRDKGANSATRVQWSNQGGKKKN